MAPPLRPASPSLDELLTIGTPGVVTPLSGLPVLRPVRRERRRPEVVALVVVVAVLITGLVGLLTEFAGRQEPTASAAPARAKPVAVRAARVEAVARPRVTPVASPVAPSAPVVAAGPSQPPASLRVPAGPQERAVPRARVFLSAAPPPPDPTPAVAPAPAPTPSPTPPAEARPRSSSDRLEDLIDRAVPPEDVDRQPESSPPAAHPAATEAVRPAGPSRDEVSAAMAAVAPDVRACGQGTTGVAQVRVVFAASGRATTATVTSQLFVGTPAGSCIARAVRGARVPAFSSTSPFVVVYPFTVR